MNSNELRDWIIETGVSEDLQELTRRMVIGELDNIVDAPAPNSELSVDWSKLIFAASVLARSEQRSHQEAALRIATGAVTLSDSKAVKDAGAVLLGKLSNFRAFSLARGRGHLTEGLHGRLGVGLRVEAQRREMDQSVLVESSGAWMPVNDFQRRFWITAEKKHWLSASAPTASGKTFLVLQWLIDQVRSDKAGVVIYLAPTRALVSEIENSLVEFLGVDGGVEISSLPLREKYLFARDEDKPIIFVFTQERLHLLANILSDDLFIDLLVVDEAHKVGDNQRGIILQDAVERAERANPDLRVVFLSPATQNPEELLSDAPSKVTVGSVDSDAPTVLQNLILAEQVPGKPKLWKLSVRQQESTLSVGVLQLASSPSTLRKKLAFIAAAGGRDGTLIYVNRAVDAEEVAGLISQVIPACAEDPELTELANLARKGVHPQFKLAALVERGVAFHYGNMPSLIRLEVERLFRSGKIRFLACTSTLIEGVNLSCRTIVVRGPRKGQKHVMEPHDFWNLAGRAGRWGDEFQGNIICVDPYDTDAWPEGVPSRSRYPIKRESDAVIERGAELVDYLDRRATVSFEEIGDSGRYEQVGAYLLATHLRLGSIVDAHLASRHDPAVVERIDVSLAALASQIEIGYEVARRHPGVSALGLQSLLEAFRSYHGPVENLLPVTVDSRDSYDRFVTIMRRINRHLFPVFEPEGAIPLYAVIVVQWLKGFSLAEMIRKDIDYHKRNRRSYRLPALIRRAMELVEQVARFKAPKYFSAYVDVLHIYLKEINRSDLIDGDLDIGTQLEFGVSTKTLWSLMELGLSRMSAVALFEKIAMDNLGKEECISWVVDRERELDGMDMPEIIIREIRMKLASSASG